tara:strand:- start:77 stop:634 length:558 start_codon:yes stop_codon:yes gene_type:complete
MADKWNKWYENLNKKHMSAFVYGDTETYQLGYNFLNSCNKVEDWGCGTGGFKRFFQNDNSTKYLGIDGSITPFSDIKEDLITYNSNVDGIFMRHVLEHNYEWEKILNNACKSFNSKMCLILFTPFKDKTTQIAHNLKHGVDVPDLSFSKSKLIDIFEKHNIKHHLISLITDTGYKLEHVFFLEKQ